MIHDAPSPILVIDLSVLLFHHAPSPISVTHLSALMLHQAPSPILVIDRLANCWESRFVVRKATKRPAETSEGKPPAVKVELDKRLMKDITDKLSRKNFVNPKWLASKARMHLDDLVKQDTLQSWSLTCQCCCAIMHPLQSQTFTCQCCCSIMHPLQSWSLTCQCCCSIMHPLQSQTFTCQCCCSIKHPLQSYSVTAGHCHCHSHSQCPLVFFKILP